jgi:hypothetical protein
MLKPSFNPFNMSSRAGRVGLAALVLSAGCAEDSLSPGKVPPGTVYHPDGSYTLYLPSTTATVGGTGQGLLVKDTLVARLDGTTLSPRSWGDTWLITEAEGKRDSVALRVRSPEPTAVWRFTIEYGFKGDPGVPVSASDLAIAQRQVDTVNARFNVPGTFDGIFQFELGRVYRITSIAEEMETAPQADYRALVDPNDMNHATGYYGDAAIVFAWNAFAGGLPFSHALHAATLAHELGHARGAIDIYSGEVGVPARNTVNGATYKAPPSMMATSGPGWDANSRNVINANAGRKPAVEAHAYTNVAEDLVIRVTNGQGSPLDASVQVYPVVVYSFRVDPPAIRDGQTGSDGEITFANPYKSAGLGNLLVVATSAGKSAHTWVTVDEVQLRRMRDPAASAFEVRLEIR